MEFDFLPKLPNSNLDDRTFQDLVDECILRIPRYCPEWTDHNPSDPGITLIELFSWLTDQMLFRFNQVPRRNYVAFLELLGIRLQPPASARTNLTFYLSSALEEAYCVPADTEVATEQTQTDEEIVFSTDHPLWIGKPNLTHFLTSQTVEDSPQALRDRVTDLWTREASGQWQGSEQSIFDEQPQPGNSFYLVLDPEQPLEGNVLAITLKGAAATPTGINPNFPPRRWEAWNGEHWQSVLLGERDDETRGFSFSEMAEQGENPIQGADVTLHVPQHWPVTRFTTYQGRWLRCVYTTPAANQPGYSSSPRIIGLEVQAIGATVGASHSIQVRSESLGTSEGTPGQTFQLQGAPILARRSHEYLLVTPPGGLPQTWKEVTDFADSGPEDFHYTLDSLTGTIQFGPLIREPVQIKQQTQMRATFQQQAQAVVARELEELSSLERQYGAVPPREASLVMMSYRMGGGRQGNVQPETLSVLKSAVPYVSRVLNHIPARNGADGESLDQAVLRAPQMLRTRDRAVTTEDFETLTQRSAGGAVARVRCLHAVNPNEAGTVRLVVVPQANTDLLKLEEGMSPELFALSPQLHQQILGYLSERQLLGIQVQLQEPEYVGVQVQTEIGLQPEYNNPRAQEEVLFNMRMALYRYLNPLTGGPDGKGWPFGRPVYPSDIVALLQQTPGVLYLGAVLLFGIHKRGENWVRTSSPDPIIDPGPMGLICSWADNRLRSSHVINPMNPMGR